MSGRSTAAPPSGRGSSARGRALLVALVTTVVYVALLVGSYGFISLATDQDVISEPDAGPLIGPAMVIVACIVVFVAVLRGLPTARGAVRLPVARSVTAALSVYLVGPAVGATLYALGRHQAFTAVVFFFHNLGSEFVIASALIALIVVFVLPIVDRPSI